LSHLEKYWIRETTFIAKAVHRTKEMRYDMQLIDKSQESIMTEIREANLNYLMLAQQMIQADKDQAIFRLGVSQDIADLIGDLSNSQLIKLASSTMMLMRFRFDDAAMLGMLTKNTKGLSQSIVHSSILMAGQKAEAIA
jgi:flagellar transcriptional activator FlhD